MKGADQPFQVLLPRFVAFLPLAAGTRRLCRRQRFGRQQRQRRRRRDGERGLERPGVHAGPLLRRLSELQSRPLLVRLPRLGHLGQDFQVYELVIILQLFQLDVGVRTHLVRRRLVDGGQRKGKLDQTTAAGRQHEVVVVDIDWDSTDCQQVDRRRRRRRRTHLGLRQRVQGGRSSRLLFRRFVDFVRVHRSGQRSGRIVRGQAERKTGSTDFWLPVCPGQRRHTRRQDHHTG